MLICHLSDWHASLTSLPEADIYVVTGDMLPNFPETSFRIPGGGEGVLHERDRWPEGAIYMGRKIIRELEVRGQREWCEMNPFREATGIPDSKPVVCVRGNHDFVDLGPWIGGNVWEISEDPTRVAEISGLVFGGMRGIPWCTGEWMDELYPDGMESRARNLPHDIDVLVTHAPPEGILDIGRYFENIGSPEIMSYVHRRSYAVEGLPLRPLRAHFFGHLHNNAGGKNMGGVVFSNAAETMRMVEL